jgi:predicted enzyme related to lactoylglutathione lyase
VGWHELLVSDLERIFTFYSELLGWRKAGNRADATGMYQLFSDGTETVGSMGTMPGFSTLPLWLYYFNVDNIDEAAKRVQANGGKILFGPLGVPDRGRLVQCADAQGAIFGLIDRRVRITVGCYSARVPEGPVRGPWR